MDVEPKEEINKHKSKAKKAVVQQKWRNISEGKSIMNLITSGEQTICPEPGTSSTEGWIRTLWNQGNPYYNVNGDLFLVGCVTTAMGQTEKVVFGKVRVMTIL